MQVDAYVQPAGLTRGRMALPGSFPIIRHLIVWLIGSVRQITVNSRAWVMRPWSENPTHELPYFGESDRLNKNSVFASPVAIFCKLKPSSLQKETASLS